MRNNQIQLLSVLLRVTARRFSGSRDFGTVRAWRMPCARILFRASFSGIKEWIYGTPCAAAPHATGSGAAG
ncbi:hypothetical protein FRAHR75_690015 [Frankia sp. Hr75.2]|nr:hypothetical protein FRAHR75_690015 [Frankia sp. Hr75.2]SQD99469.1 hypothetical protein FMEAI12_5290046 [Parafrankia sp. Ea1.12]